MKNGTVARTAALALTIGLAAAMTACGSSSRPGPRQETWTAESCLPLLLRALKDENCSVRRNAACALGRTGPSGRDAVPALVCAMKDPDPGVRRAAARSLGRLGPNAKDAVPALTAALEDPEIMNDACEALERIQSAR